MHPLPPCDTPRERRRLPPVADEHRGCKLQIYDVPGATNPTGSIYGHVATSDLRCRDGEWCLVRIVSGDACQRRLRQRAHRRRVVPPAAADEGRIGFQMHSAGQIEYFEPDVRPLQ